MEGGKRGKGKSEGGKLFVFPPFPIFFFALFPFFISPFLQTWTNLLIFLSFVSSQDQDRVGLRNGLGTKQRNHDNETESIWSSKDCICNKSARKAHSGK